MFLGHSQSLFTFNLFLKHSFKVFPSHQSCKLWQQSFGNCYQLKLCHLLSPGNKKLVFYFSKTFIMYSRQREWSLMFHLDIHPLALALHQSSQDVWWCSQWPAISSWYHIRDCVDNRLPWFPCCCQWCPWMSSSWSWASWPEQPQLIWNLWWAGIPLSKIQSHQACSISILM